MVLEFAFYKNNQKVKVKISVNCLPLPENKFSTMIVKFF